MSCSGPSPVFLLSVASPRQKSQNLVTTPTYVKHGDYPHLCQTWWIPPQMYVKLGDHPHLCQTWWPPPHLCQTWWIPPAMSNFQNFPLGVTNIHACLLTCERPPFWGGPPETEVENNDKPDLKIRLLAFSPKKTYGHIQQAKQASSKV